MILLGIFDMFTACDGKTAWGFLPFLLGAGILGYLFRHFFGGNNNNKAKEYETQLSDWQGKYTTLQNDFKGYKSSITASSRDSDKQVGDLTNRIKSLEADIRNLADEKNKLSMSLTEKQTDLGGYSRKISTLEETIASINDEKNKLSADWGAKLSAANESLSKASAWESRMKQAEEELARAKAAVSDANKKQVEAEMRLKTTSEVAGKVVPLETEVKTWKEKYASLETQLNEKASAATVYGTQLTDTENKYKTLVDENGKLKSTIGEKDKAVAEWEAKWRTANEAANKLGALEGEIKSLKDNNTGFQTKLQEKDKAIAEWEAKWRAANETTGKLGALETEVKLLKDNNTGFQTKLQEKDKAIAEWETKWRTANETANKLGALEGEIKLLKDNNAGFQSKLQDKDKSIADWEMKWKAANEAAGKVNSLQTDVNNWKSKHDALQAQLSGKASAENDWNNKLQALTNENNQLKNNLDDRNKYSVDLEGKLKTAELSSNRIAGLEKSIGEWESKWKIANDAASRINGLETDARNWKAKHDALASQLNNHSGIEAEWNRKLQLLTNENGQLKNNLEGRNKYAGELETRLGVAESAASRISVLEREVEEWKTKYNNARTQAATNSTTYAAVAAPKKKDDLTKIEGIGPKINGLLNKAGISTFEQLSNTTPTHIQSILHAAGPRYRMHDASTLTWPRQARMAADGKWAELKKWQDESLSVGRMKEGGSTTIKKVRVKRTGSGRGNKDDLKKIEGIGPKINGLLNKAGIYTFAQLAETKTDRLREILEKAGERFRMHDPSTWPKQSDLAANDKWEQLEKMQDQLKGGRKV